MTIRAIERKKWCYRSQGRATDAQLQISWIELRGSSRSALEQDEEIDLFPSFLHMFLHSSVQSANHIKITNMIQNALTLFKDLIDQEPSDVSINYLLILFRLKGTKTNVTSAKTELGFIYIHEKPEFNNSITTWSKSILIPEIFFLSLLIPSLLTVPYFNLEKIENKTFNLFACTLL